MNLSINLLKPQTKISVNGAGYSVLAKVLYISVKTGRKYWKVFLSGGAVLGYNLPDEDAPAYFGELIHPLPFDYDNLPDEIIYDEKTYKKDGDDDYERVLHLEFGSVEDAEGECRFINYSANDGSWLSPGMISETGKRADFFGKDLSEYEIKIV